MPLKPSPNHGRDSEQPGLALRQQKADHRGDLADRAGQDRAASRRSGRRHKPQNCRLTKAQPSSTESIAAPCDVGIPTSLQNATRWPCGIAIGTQHRKPAAAQSAEHDRRPEPQHRRRRASDRGGRPPIPRGFRAPGRKRAPPPAGSARTPARRSPASYCASRYAPPRRRRSAPRSRRIPRSRCRARPGRCRGAGRTSATRKRRAAR